MLLKNAPFPHFSHKAGSVTLPHHSLPVWSNFDCL